MSAREFDVETIRGLVRARIETGRLPRSEASRVWGGFGDGRACVVCERPIGPQDVEYELVFRPNAREVIARLHIVCYSAWQSELKARSERG